MPTVRKNDPTTIAADDWVSLPKAAELLGRHRQKVLLMALRGELVSDQKGDWTFISRESIDRFLAADAVK